MTAPNLEVVSDNPEPVRWQPSNPRWSEPIDMRPILRDARWCVFVAYYHAGPTAAFAAIAAQAIRLQYHIESGALAGHSAESCLRDVADSFNLADMFGEDRLEIAIHAGAEFYQSLADYEAQSRKAA